MITFNPTLRALEVRIVLSIRKHFKLTRGQALSTLRRVTGGRGIETADCWGKIFLSKNRKDTVKEIFNLS